MIKGMKKKTALFLFFYIIFLSGTSFALDVKRFVMPNGLTVLVAERHNLPIVTFSLLIKASPFDEDEDKAGLASLTAELLTEGTKKRKAGDISEEIEFIGASLDSSANSDFTSITLSVLKKDLEKGFDILSDILLHPTFPEEEINRKKAMIKGNLKQFEEDPSFVADRAFRRAVYGNHPYGRLVTGTENTIDRIKREDLIEFHSTYYRPNNTILSVAGDVTENEVKELFDRYLHQWHHSKIPDKKSTRDVKSKERVILIDKDLTQANIIIGHKGLKREDPDYYTVSVMNYILGGGGFSSRLMQRVRDEMGLAYDIHSLFDARKEGGFFYVKVQTKNDSASKVIEEILEAFKRIRAEAVSDQEIEDAKAYLTGSFPRRLDTNRKIADLLVAMEFYNLGLDYINKYPELIKSITKDDIIKVAKKYINLEDLVFVVVAKQSEAGVERNKWSGERK